MTSHRFEQLPPKRALSVFFTAGHPRRDDTMVMLEALQEAEVDMVEIGFPFSDPVADGPTIQEGNARALANGMTVERLFEQLRELRSSGVTYPVLLMGYLNPVERYGATRFFEEAGRCGVDGLILPDMPFEEYLTRYRPLYEKHGLKPVFLITSRTSPDRIRAFDEANPGFIYVVSSDAVTGGTASVTHDRDAFFKRLHEMKLRSRLIVGFGVSDRESFHAVTIHTHGAIIGSAFVRAVKDLPQGASEVISDAAALKDTVKEFIKQVR